MRAALRPMANHAQETKDNRYSSVFTIVWDPHKDLLYWYGTVVATDDFDVSWS